MRYLITGGAGFIGSAVIRHLIGRTAHEVVNFDKLTYAATLTSLVQVEDDARYRFVHGDICDPAKVAVLIDEVQPDRILHLAAESHVDRSIDSAADFINTNLIGTYVLLEAALAYWRGRSEPDTFRFQHISTDEVYGSLGAEGLFTETTRYKPNSPYSASKAGSDHLVRAWGKTYGLPVVTTNCSNNYGPYQFPEKLIPLMIINALEGKPLPVYGSGANVRDWLYVDDHAAALVQVSEQAQPGAVYNIGGNEERSNLAVVEAICAAVNASGQGQTNDAASLIAFVKDRPGHDARYAIDASKIAADLGFTPSVSFEEGLARTVEWYLARRDWWEPIRTSTYEGQRLGNG